MTRRTDLPLPKGSIPQPPPSKSGSSWTWKSWTMFGVVVAIFIAATVVLVVALTTEEDPRLLQVCWSPQGEVQYVGGGFDDPGLPQESWICDEPDDLRWPDDHLRVLVIHGDGTTYNGDSSDARMVVEAMELLNDQLDVRLERTDDADDADITITFRAVYEIGDDTDMEAIDRVEDVGGWCVHRRDESGRMWANAVVRPAGNIRTEYRRAAHELGHCLGLPHWRVGLMREGDLDDSDAERMEFDAFASPQRALMRETY